MSLYVKFHLETPYKNTEIIKIKEFPIMTENKVIKEEFNKEVEQYALTNISFIQHEIALTKKAEKQSKIIRQFIEDCKDCSNWQVLDTEIALDLIQREG